jgi:hypothetical protein
MISYTVVGAEVQIPDRQSLFLFGYIAILTIAGRPIVIHLRASGGAGPRRPPRARPDAVGGAIVDGSFAERRLEPVKAPR